MSSAQPLLPALQLAEEVETRSQLPPQLAFCRHPCHLGQGAARRRYHHNLKGSQHNKVNRGRGQCTAEDNMVRQAAQAGSAAGRLHQASHAGSHFDVKHLRLDGRCTHRGQVVHWAEGSEVLCICELAVILVLQVVLLQAHRAGMSHKRKPRTRMSWEMQLSQRKWQPAVSCRGTCTAKL